MLTDNLFGYLDRRRASGSARYNQFNGSSDLYPLLNKNLHNNWIKNVCALRIQRVWRQFLERKREKELLNQQFKENMKIPEKFASWFSY